MLSNIITLLLKSMFKKHSEASLSTILILVWSSIGHAYSAAGAGAAAAFCFLAAQSAQ